MVLKKASTQALAGLVLGIFLVLSSFVYLPAKETFMQGIFALIIGLFAIGMFALNNIVKSKNEFLAKIAGIGTSIAYPAFMFLNKIILLISVGAKNYVFIGWLFLALTLLSSLSIIAIFVLSLLHIFEKEKLYGALLFVFLGVAMVNIAFTPGGGFRVLGNIQIADLVMLSCYAIIIFDSPKAEPQEATAEIEEKNEEQAELE